MFAIQKTKGACLSTAWYLITHQNLKRVPPDQDGMTLCLLGTVGKDETGETELDGWFAENQYVCLYSLLSLHPNFCGEDQEFQDLCSVLIHVLESPLQPLSQNESSQG